MVSYIKYRLLPYPFNNTYYTADATSKMNFTLIEMKIGNYPVSFELYENKRWFIKNEIFRMDNATYMYDVVIHVRLDDIFNFHWQYTLVPLSYYRDTLENIKVKNGSKICLIGRAIDEQQQNILTDIRAYVEQLTQSSVVIHTGSIVEDFIDLRSGIFNKK